VCVISYDAICMISYDMPVPWCQCSCIFEFEISVPAYLNQCSCIFEFEISVHAYLGAGGKQSVCLHWGQPSMVCVCVLLCVCVRVCVAGCGGYMTTVR